MTVRSQMPELEHVGSKNTPYKPGLSNCLISIGSTVATCLALITTISADV